MSTLSPSTPTRLRSPSEAGSPRIGGTPDYINKLFKMKSTTAPVTSKRQRRKSIDAGSGQSAYSEMLSANNKLYEERLKAKQVTIDEQLRLVTSLQGQIESLQTAAHKEKSKRANIEERHGVQSKVSASREKSYFAELEKARKELAEQKEHSQALREKLLLLRATLRQTHHRVKESNAHEEPWGSLELMTTEPVHFTAKVNSELLYDGVVNGSPRIQIPIEQRETNKHGCRSRVTLKNSAGKQIEAPGVNHFAWDGVAIYVWPVKYEREYKESILQEYRATFAVGEEITVDFEGGEEVVQEEQVEDEAHEIDVLHQKYDEDVESYIKIIEGSILELTGSIAVHREKVNTLETQHKIVHQEKGSIEGQINELQQTLQLRDAALVTSDSNVKRHSERADRFEALSQEKEKEAKKYLERLTESEHEHVRLASEIKRLNVQLKEFSDISASDVQIEFSGDESKLMNDLVGAWTDVIDESIGQEAESGKVGRQHVSEELLKLLEQDAKYHEWIVEVGIEEEAVFTKEMTRRVLEGGQDDVLLGVHITHTNKKLLATEIHQMLSRDVIIRVELKDEDVAEEVVARKLNEKLQENQKPIQEKVTREERDNLKDLIQDSIAQYEQQHRGHQETDDCVPREEQKKIVDHHAKELAEKILASDKEPRPIIEHYLHEQFHGYAAVQKQAVIVKEHKQSMEQVNDKLNGLKLLLGGDKAPSSGESKSSSKSLITSIETVESFIKIIDELQYKVFDTTSRKHSPVEFIQKMKQHISDMEALLHLEKPKGNKNYDMLAEIRREVDLIVQEHETMEQIMHAAESKVRETLHKQDYHGITIKTKKSFEPEPYSQWTSAIMSQYDQQETTSGKQATLLWMMMKLLRSNTHSLNQAKEDMKGLEQAKDIKIEQLARENQELNSQLAMLKQQMSMMHTFRSV